MKKLNFKGLMMKTKYIIFGVVLAFVFFFSSCDESLLDIPQKGVTSIDNFYQTDNDAMEAIAAIYDEAWYGTYGRGALFGHYQMIKNSLSDDVYSGGLSRNDQSLYEALNEYTFEAENSYILANFENLYKLIYRCNLILDNFTGDNLDTDTKKEAVAQAKVWRAWAYIELITFWGTPPLIDHTLTVSEYKQGNGNPEELWNLVVTDLTDAINSGNLMQKSSTTDKIATVTKGYAQALLGKAYVFMNYSLAGGAYGGSQATAAVSAAAGGEYWDDAVTVLDQVINSGVYELFDGPFAYILKEETNWCPENMFEFNRIYNNSNTENNLTTFFEMFIAGWANSAITGHGDILPHNRASNFLTPRQEAYDAMVAWQGEDNPRLYGSIRTYEQLVNDMGVGVKLGVYTLYACDGLFDMKWFHEEGYCHGFHNNEKNYPMMRYSEVLLLAAEANLMAGNQGKADGYMNEVRNRAGLDDMSGVTLSDIQQEKRCELYMEGVRAYDLVRWGLADDFMSNQGDVVPYFTAYTEGANFDNEGNFISLDSQWEGIVTVNGENFELGVIDDIVNSAGYGWKEGKHELLPFPQSEMLVNGVDVGGNLVQNPGW